MNKYIFYAKIKVEVESELSAEEAKAELESESLYNIDSTENVTVIETEWQETQIKEI